jgi:hypothetical protein
MPLSFAQSVSIAENVMFRELDGEAVILDLEAERYYGLDEVGTRMWVTVTEAASIEAAFTELLDEYDAEPGTLRDDLVELLTALLDRGLIEVSDG